MNVVNKTLFFTVATTLFFKKFWSMALDYALEKSNSAATFPQNANHGHQSILMTLNSSAAHNPTTAAGELRAT